jgi:dihydroorotase
MLRTKRLATSLTVVLGLLMESSASAAEKYDLLLRGGHVIDPRNKVSKVCDVAIRDGKIAAMAAKIDPAVALKAVDVTGLYVTPGLIDLHVHVFTGTGERSFIAGDSSVAADAFSFRSGVTAMADAGCAGWRNFEEFKRLVIDRSRTRVFAFLNIVGHGMRGGRYEQNLDDMDARATAEMAQRHKGTIVGIKTAHYSRPDFTAVERAVQAGTIANIPVMVDFGRNHPQRPLEELLTRKLRPGDI